MKYITISIFILLITVTASSQRLFFHAAGGMMNYGGDLQDKLFTFDQANSAYALGASYKVFNRFAISASYTTGKLAASDTKNHTDTYTRNLSFYTRLHEASLVLEADLQDVPGTTKFTPYFTAGIGVFHYDPYTFDFQGNKVFLQPLSTEGQGLPQYPDRKTYSLTQFAIPFGFGIKYAITNNLIIGAEASFRRLFTDYIDDASTNYADTAILLQEKGPLSAELSYRGDELNPPVPFNIKARRANSDKKDTYYTALIKISFSFNNLNSSNSAYSRRTRKQASCPAKLL
jgi:opacity protein-like surface antigen